MSAITGGGNFSIDPASLQRLAQNAIKDSCSTSKEINQCLRIKDGKFTYILPITITTTKPGTTANAGQNDNFDVKIPLNRRKGSTITEAQMNAIKETIKNQLARKIDEKQMIEDLAPKIPALANIKKLREGRDRSDLGNFKTVQDIEGSLIEKYDDPTTYKGPQIDLSPKQVSSTIDLLNTYAMCLDSEKAEQYSRLKHLQTTIQQKDLSEGQRTVVDKSGNKTVYQQADVEGVLNRNIDFNEYLVLLENLRAANFQKAVQEFKTRAKSKMSPEGNLEEFMKAIKANHGEANTVFVQLSKERQKAQKGEPNIYRQLMEGSAKKLEELRKKS
ncbi:MAG: hypothetical protein LBS71_02385 [Puniceicoccales bacterium]|jgi:hypothetical protein|nr:hypothetical protein [Puniceicoccales bacterium]